jgi:hypothetical protein
VLPGTVRVSEPFPRRLHPLQLARKQMLPGGREYSGSITVPGKPSYGPLSPENGDTPYWESDSPLPSASAIPSSLLLGIATQLSTWYAPEARLRIDTSAAASSSGAS